MVPSALNVSDPTSTISIMDVPSRITVCRTLTTGLIKPDSFPGIFAIAFAHIEGDEILETEVIRCHPGSAPFEFLPCPYEKSDVYGQAPISAHKQILDQICSQDLIYYSAQFHDAVLRHHLGNPPKSPAPERFCLQRIVTPWALNRGIVGENGLPSLNAVSFALGVELIDSYEDAAIAAVHQVAETYLAFRRLMSER